MLNRYEDDLKEGALNTLALLDPESTTFLLDKLEKLPAPESPGTLKEKVRLQEWICTALGRTGSQESIPALNLIVERKDPLNTDIYNKGVQEAAKGALEMIKQAQAKKDEVIVPSEEKDETGSEEMESADDELSQQLKPVNKHVEQGDTESAVKLLLDMIVKYAKQKDFEKADLLRDKLMEVNPMALTEIVKSSEVIEEEKNAVIDQDRLKTWSELYDKLNQAETHALYFAMKSAELDANETVFQQGETISRLYFINSGKIKLITKEEGKEIPIKELGTGDIFGQDTFFSLTVCTVSAITISKVELDFLEKEIVTKWDKDFPGLNQKINDYCLKLENTSEMLSKQGKSRRAYERINISGRVSMQVLDEAGSPVREPITGSLADISMGGLSFYIKTTKEKADKMFLDQKVNIKFKIKTDDSEHKVDQMGMVVGVIPHLYDYSVHIKFDNILDEKMIQDIKESSGSEDEELELLTDP
jgi:CRP-like cAMP-binding protein